MQWLVTILESARRRLHHGPRLVRIERTLSQIQTEIQKMSALLDAVTAVQAADNSAVAKIAALKAEVAALQATVDSQTAALAEVPGAVDSLNASAAAVTAAVA